jgi:hypothetical protein
MTLVKLGFIAAALATFGLAYVARSEPGIMAPLIGFGGLLLGSITREIGAPK